MASAFALAIFSGKIVLLYEWKMTAVIFHSPFHALGSRRQTASSHRKADSFLFGHESGHSIARPTACGSRVPPQRTVLGETPAHAPERASDIHLRRLLGRYGLCTVERLCALCAALRPQAAPACALAAQRARQLEADGVCCRVRQLAVNGRDLMAAGIPAGPALRRVLEALLDGVIRAEYPNEKPALLAAAQKIIAS